MITGLVKVNNNVKTLSSLNISLGKQRVNKMIFLFSFTPCLRAMVKYANKKLGTSNTSKNSKHQRGSTHKCSKPLFVIAVVR